MPLNGLHGHAHLATTATGGFTAINSFGSCLNQGSARSTLAAGKDGSPGT
jgi:hypothetical protein